MELHTVARNVWDAVVVGAGPAGSLVARQLAHTGASVLLVDKQPLGRAKVCGCCLGMAAIKTLSAVGLSNLVDRIAPVPLRQIRLGAAACEATVPLAGGVAVSREVFDSALVREAVASGATFLPNTLALLNDCREGCRTVDLSVEGQFAQVRATLVIAADGLGNNLVRRNGAAGVIAHGSLVGAGTILPASPAYVGDGTVYMACSPHGYVGMVLLKDGRLNVAAALKLDAVRAAGGPGPLAARIIADVGWPMSDNLFAVPWRGTAPLTRRASRLADERLFVLGDAAGYIEPFTGEGMAWALKAAVAVTPLALQAITAWDGKLATDWAHVYQRTIASRQAICRNFAWGLRHPFLVSATIRLLRSYPALAKPIINRLAG